MEGRKADRFHFIPVRKTPVLRVSQTLTLEAWAWSHYNRQEAESYTRTRGRPSNAYPLTYFHQPGSVVFKTKGDLGLRCRKQEVLGCILELVPNTAIVRKLGERQRTHPPQSPEEEPTLLTPWHQTSSSQKYEGINLSCFQLLCVLISSGPGKPTHPTTADYLSTVSMALPL